jgi:DNA modification methylase
MPRLKTKTSSFGTSKREGHDATQFYSSNLYNGLKIDENQEIIDHSNLLPSSLFIDLVEFSIEKLKIIPDYCIHLIIFDCTGALNGKLFDNNLESRFKLLLQEFYRILITGGKITIFVDDKDYSNSYERYQPFHAFLALEMIQIGFIMRGEVIWKYNREKITEKSVNPPKVSNLRLCYNHIMIFSKQVMKRKKDTNIDTISRDQFLQCTKSIWKHQPELMNEIKSIGDYDKELLDCYNRILQLYSFESDKILFMIPLTNKMIASIARQLRKNIIGFFYHDF